MEWAGLVDIQCLDAGPRPLDSSLPRLAVERDVARAEVRQDAEIFGATTIGAGGHDQPADAALDFPLELALEVDGRLLVGLGGQDRDCLGLRRDGIEGALNLTGTDLPHLEPFALALEQA